MKRLDRSTFSKAVPLPDGSSVVLVDRLCADASFSDADVEKNIFRLSSNGDILWQVHGAKPIYPRSPFTNIWLDQDGGLKASSWDGVEYDIAVESGEAKSSRFMK
jgi:hypothetical protein